MPDPSGESIDALVTDQYLDALLAQVEPRATSTAARSTTILAPWTVDGASPSGPVEAPAADEPGLDPSVAHAVAVLRATLLRAHPSFRFEERLAGRLAAMAAESGQRDFTLVAIGSGEVIPFPAGSGRAADPLLAAVLAGQLDPSDELQIDRASGVRSPARPLLVGGAITSAAISLVGVAWVAWRASRPAGSPMSRAARVARARRMADLAELAAGLPGGPA